MNESSEVSRHKSRGCSFLVEGVTPSTQKLHPRLLCRLNSNHIFIVETAIYIYTDRSRVPRMNESYESSRHKSRECSIVSGGSVAFSENCHVYTHQGVESHV